MSPALRWPPASSSPAPAWTEGRPGKVGTLLEDVVRVDRTAFPPALGFGQPEHRKVQVGRVFRGIARNPDETDDLSLLELLAFPQVVRIPVQVSIVVAIP